jgi:hypothetical protein
MKATRHDFEILHSITVQEPKNGRDIALRCPRPRTSGRDRGGATSRNETRVAPLVRGSDGAARHPYLLPSNRIQ